MLPAPFPLRGVRCVYRAIRPTDIPAGPGRETLTCLEFIEKLPGGEFESVYTRRVNPDVFMAYMVGDTYETPTELAHAFQDAHSS